MRMIYLHPGRYRGGPLSDWLVIMDKRPMRGLCFDEMLGALARFGLGHQFGAKRLRHVSPRTIAVTQIEDHWWTIERGGKFISYLTFDEMLGFIACLVLTGRELFSGMKTYEQTMRDKYQRRHPIAALLPA